MPEFGNSTKQYRSIRKNYRRVLAKYSCHNCKKKFHHPEQLLLHRTLRHGHRVSPIINNPPTTLQSYNCRLCNTSFPDSSPLEEHMYNAHPENIITVNRYQCSGCSKTFETPTKLLSHIESLPKSGSHNLAMYKDHISNMTNINRCDICIAYVE